MNRAYLITISTLAFIALAVGLFSGAEWLGIETWLFGILAGNFAAWGLLVAWSALAWASTLSRHSRPFSRHSRPFSRHSRESGNLETTAPAVTHLHRIALMLLALAVAWLPLSIALFGNVNLNNAGPVAYNIWLGYTGLLALAPPLLLLAAATQWIWKALSGLSENPLDPG